MEALVALIANDQLYIVVLVGKVAYLADHVLQPLVPLFSRDLSGPESEVPFALLGATEAFGEGRAIDIKLVVKGELLVLQNILGGEYSDADFPQHIPLLGDAVRVAGVVDEASQVALVGRVDHLSLRSFHQVRARGLRVLAHSKPPDFGVYREDLPDVLHDEVASLDELASLEAPALAPRWERVNASVVMLLEFAVLAEVPAVASLVIALGRNHPVQAAVPTVIGHICILGRAASSNKYVSFSPLGRHRQLSMSSFLGVFLLRSR